MKYIKTKDGIFKVLDYSTNCGESYYRIKPGDNGWIWTCSDDIIKEADTIEELLDGDVLFENGKLRKIHSKKEGFGIKEYGNTANRTIRGFIETNKGLIYVTETNEKGEFELL